MLLHCGEMGEKVGKSRNLGLTLTHPPHKFILGAPKIVKPVLDTPFQGLLLQKLWITPSLTPLGFFSGQGSPIGVHKLDIMTHYHLQKFEVTVTLDPWAKPVWILKFTNFDPRKFIWGAPEISKPLLDTVTPFQGILLGKVWTMPPNTRGWENWAIFWPIRQSISKTVRDTVWP